MSGKPVTIGVEHSPAYAVRSPADAHLTDARDLRDRPTIRIRMRRWAVRRVLRAGMLKFLAIRWLLRFVHRTPRRWAAGKGGDILLTGTFHSRNWINAHLRPLAAASRCGRLIVVSDFPIPPMPKLELIQPSRFLSRLFGRVGARLLTFGWVALTRRPHVVGGFHLLFNGLAAQILAHLAGARSLYFCVGGPAEVLGGGIWSENRVFTRLDVPDPVIESRLVRAVAGFDLIVTMGARAVTFFRQHGVDAPFCVISGAIDPEQFHPADAPPTNDLVFVGRLAPIKRVDILLRIVQALTGEFPGVRALIVGDGELRVDLERLARDLGVERHVTFVGARSDIGDLLRSARIFLLTSDSEGLALSLMEAMTCGLAPVVSDVGDLGELVRDGENGFLAPPRDVERFADRVARLLRDEPLRAAFADQARLDAIRYAPPAVARQWDDLLAECVEH